MKDQRHPHKESFSLLLISHTGGKSRQFHLSLARLRLFFFLLALTVFALIGLIVLSATEHGRQSALRAQLIAQQHKNQQLEADMKILEEEKSALARENGLLQLTAMSQTATRDNSDEEENQTDPDFPGLYPSSETGLLIATYSPETPYLSINTHIEDHIVAAANGTIVSVTSDDTYPVIVEIEHINGYRTRYMCRQSAQLEAADDAAVQAGDTLLVITADNTQLDYQVFLNDEAIDPLNVIDAKG